jgi:hypothetical protein
MPPAPLHPNRCLHAPQVLAAVQKAALHPVRLHALQQQAGEYIARRLNCEGAIVRISFRRAALEEIAREMSEAEHLS